MSYAKPTKAKTLTPEQIRAERARFFAEKRETFALNILCCLCQDLKANTPTGKDFKGDVVDLAVAMADKLMEKLYSPTPKEGESK